MGENNRTKINYIHSAEDMEYDASPFQEKLQHHVKKVRIFRFFIEFLSFTIGNRIHVFGPFSHLGLGPFFSAIFRFSFAA